MAVIKEGRLVVRLMREDARAIYEWARVNYEESRRLRGHNTLEGDQFFRLMAHTVLAMGDPEKEMEINLAKRKKRKAR